MRKITLFALITLLSSCSKTTIKSNSDTYKKFNKTFLYEEEEYAQVKKRLSEGKYLDCIKAYEKLVKDYPESKYIDESYFMRGYIYNNHLNDTVNAKKHLQYLIDNFPDSQYRPSAKFEIKNLGNPGYIPDFD